jgi:hypothetical protein
MVSLASARFAESKQSRTSPQRVLLEAGFAVLIGVLPASSCLAAGNLGLSGA